MDRPARSCSPAHRSSAARCPYPCHLDGVKVRPGAAFQDASACAQRGDHGRDELVPLMQGRTDRGSILIERVLDDVDDPFELDQHLDECPVAASRGDRTLAHHRIGRPGFLHSRARRVFEVQKIRFARARLRAFDEIGDRE